MLVVVLDYTNGSVHFHKIPSIEEIQEEYEEFEEPVEEYLLDVLGYSSNIHWMEILC